MIQAKEVMPGFPSSPRVHLVCQVCLIVFPLSERKKNDHLQFTNHSVLGVHTSFRSCICRKAWRWLEMLGWFAVCIPWKHTLKVTFCIQTLAWNTSAAGEAQVSRSLLLESFVLRVFQTPKGASKINVPKENREVPNRPPLVTSYWIYMNCKAQGNLRSLQTSKQDVHSHSSAAAFPPARGSCCNALILTNISCNSFLSNQKKWVDARHLRGGKR